MKGPDGPMGLTGIPGSSGRFGDQGIILKYHKYSNTFVEFI